MRSFEISDVLTIFVRVLGLDVITNFVRVLGLEPRTTEV